VDNQRDKGSGSSQEGQATSARADELTARRVPIGRENGAFGHHAAGPAPAPVKSTIVVDLTTARRSAFVAIESGFDGGFRLEGVGDRGPVMRHTLNQT
jgi:hypothetical protein